LKTCEKKKVFERNACGGGVAGRLKRGEVRSHPREAYRDQTGGAKKKKKKNKKKKKKKKAPKRRRLYVCLCPAGKASFRVEGDAARVTETRERNKQLRREEERKSGQGVPPILLNRRAVSRLGKKEFQQRKSRC